MGSRSYTMSSDLFPLILIRMFENLFSIHIRPDPR